MEVLPGTALNRLEVVMRRFISTLSLLVLSSAVAFWTIRANGGESNAADDFLRQRLEAAQDGVKMARNMYEQGMTDFQVVMTWQRRITASELAMAKTKDQRLAALQKDVEQAKELEELVQRRVSAGVAPGLDSIAAKYARLDAQAALAAEQQRP
jgi:outer membrane protein TolC